MKADTFNTWLTKLYLYMMIVGAALMVVNRVSHAAIVIGVDSITLIMLLIMAVILSIAYIGLYIAMLWKSFSNYDVFQATWPLKTEQESRLQGMYRFDNTLILLGSSCLMGLFFVHSWILWGAFFVSLFASLIVSLIICIRVFGREL